MHREEWACRADKKAQRLLKAHEQEQLRAKQEAEEDAGSKSIDVAPRLVAECLREKSSDETSEALHKNASDEASVVSVDNKESEEKSDDEDADDKNDSEEEYAAQTKASNSFAVVAHNVRSPDTRNTALLHEDGDVHIWTEANVPSRARQVLKHTFLKKGQRLYFSGREEQRRGRGRGRIRKGKVAKIL